MIFIKGNVPSSKNSRQWTGKYFIASKTVQKYMKDYSYQYYSLENVKKIKEILKGKKKPYNVEFYFIRDTKRKFDYINVAQIVQDLMVKAGWIDDDNCDEIIPIFKGYEVDKKNAGVQINIL